MNVNQLCDLIARKTGVGFTDVQLYARRLREGGCLPQGARGSKAPAVTVEHASTMLVGLLATDTARQAPDVMQRYPEVVQRLRNALADPQEAARLDSLELSRSDSAAIFYWTREPLHPTTSSVISEPGERSDLYEEGVFGSTHWSGLTTQEIEVKATISGSAVVGISQALQAEGVT